MSKFHPMAILLKFEGYPPAVLLSVFLHACLLVFIFGRNVKPSDYVTVEDPVIVTATAVDVNPQRLRRLERIQEEQAAETRRRQQEEARQRQEQEERARQEREAREAQQARERAEAEQQRQAEAQAEAERQRLADAEAERQRQAEEARRRAAEEERLREQQRLAQEQAAREAEASQVASENLVVAEYVSIIRRIISLNWQIPPSARNGMMATVELRLVPTGEVVGATVIRSSGDAVFDRSVLQAVERADRFPELQDLERGMFDRNFRTFTLVFRPEDLLR